MPDSTEQGTRRLAAIMFTDMKGFSRKMQENELAAFEILRNHDAIPHNQQISEQGVVQVKSKNAKGKRFCYLYSVYTAKQQRDA